MILSPGITSPSAASNRGNVLTSCNGPKCVPRSPREVSNTSKSDVVRWKTNVFRALSPSHSRTSADSGRPCQYFNMSVATQPSKRRGYQTGHGRECHPSHHGAQMQNVSAEGPAAVLLKGFSTAELRRPAATPGVDLARDRHSDDCCRCCGPASASRQPGPRGCTFPPRPGLSIFGCAACPQYRPAIQCAGTGPQCQLSG